MATPGGGATNTMGTPRASSNATSTAVSPNSSARLFEVEDVTVPLVACSSDSSVAVFPVRRVYCVGRNYKAHAAEMGSRDEPPFFFQKSRDCVRPIAPGSTGKVQMVPNTDQYQHEVELVVALGSGGQNIPPEAALRCVLGYSVGLDMTRRDLQRACSAAGKPWEIGKSADGSAPLGYIHPVSIFGHPAKTAAIRLELNGQQRQAARLDQMTWSVGELVSYLSQHFRLYPGDLIFTGTPAGVGPVKPGDRIRAQVEGLSDLTAIVVKPEDSNAE